MPRFTLDDVTTPQEFKYNTLAFNHDIAIAVEGAGPVSGSVVLTAKKPGSDTYEAIPDGTIDLSAPHTLVVEGTIEYLLVTPSAVAGTTKLVIQDTLYDRN